MGITPKYERVLELFFNEGTKHWHFSEIVKEAKISHTFLIDELILPQGEKDFAKIREMAKTNSWRDISSVFHIDKSNVGHIVHRRTWSHIP